MFAGCEVRYYREGVDAAMYGMKVEKRAEDVEAKVFGRGKEWCGS